MLVIHLNHWGPEVTLQIRDRDVLARARQGDGLCLRAARRTSGRCLTISLFESFHLFNFLMHVIRLKVVFPGKIWLLLTFDQIFVATELRAHRDGSLEARRLEGTLAGTP